MNAPEHEDDYGPGLLLNWTFWAGGLASLALWTGIWHAIAWLLENAR